MFFLNLKDLIGYIQRFVDDELEHDIQILVKFTSTETGRNYIDIIWDTGNSYVNSILILWGYPEYFRIKDFTITSSYIMLNDDELYTVRKKLCEMDLDIDVILHDVVDRIAKMREDLGDDENGEG